MKTHQIKTLAMILAVSVLLLSVIMMFIFPSKAELADGFTIPIIAFEFAQHEQDLAFLSGQSDIAIEHRQNMRIGLYVDMIFPIAYAGLLAVVLLSNMANRSKAMIWTSVAITMLIIPLDYNENWVMFSVLSSLDQNTLIAPLLPLLFIATWLKWGAIAVSIGLLSLLLWKNKQRITAAVAAITTLSTVYAFYSGSNGIEVEHMSNLVALFIFMLVCQCVWGFYRDSRHNHK